MKKTTVFMLTVSLSAAVLALVFTGCQKKTAAGGAAAGAAGKTVSIKVEVFDRGTDGGKTDPTNNEWTKWIKEKVLKDENIDVTFVPVNRWQEETGIVTMMAAGNPPDLCYTYSMDNVRNWGKQGGVYDLTPYVDTLLKDAQDMMGEDASIPGQNLIWHSKDVDSGALYGISNKYVMTASHNTFIRQDWLDKLGLPLPTTKEQFFSTLEAFRDNAASLNPGGQVVPYLMTTDVRWQAFNIFLSFMPSTLSSKDRWVNTVAERQLLVPGVKDAYRFLNRMYNANLIDKNLPLYKDDQDPANMMKSGAVGAFQHNWDHPYRQNMQIQSELEKNVPGAKYVPVDCFERDDGAHPKRGPQQSGGLIAFVPKSANQEKMEAALRYLNWISKYENFHFLQFGKEGVNHEVKNGVQIPLVATGAWIQNSGVNVDYTMTVNGYVVPEEDFGVVLSASYPGIPPEDIGHAYQMSSFDANPEPYVAATIDSLAAVRQTIVEKEQTLSVNLIVAKPADFDKVWDSGIKEWLASGAQAVIDEQKAEYK